MNNFMQKKNALRVHTYSRCTFLLEDLSFGVTVNGCKERFFNALGEGEGGGLNPVKKCIELVHVYTQNILKKHILVRSLIWTFGDTTYQTL